MYDTVKLRNKSSRALGYFLMQKHQAQGAKLLVFVEQAPHSWTTELWDQQDCECIVDSVPIFLPFALGKSGEAPAYARPQCGTLGNS